MHAQESVFFLNWVIAVVAVALVGCLPEPEVLEPREPRCEPRSPSASPRLGFQGTAEDYGLIPPCRAQARVSIARNTRLAAVSANFSLLDAEGEVVGRERHELELDGPRAGILSREVALQPVEDAFCADLVLQVDSLTCIDENGAAMACPQVQVLDVIGLKPLEVHGEELDICFTD